ncbi:Ohr family peroxiredoxin [Allosaccharopolyspora coralli]|uniref:Ohr family peroxiredoxin n=1 Tax=Allosaccharopolyspora coralli TaxID=2665642 RepID=A0A5Q3Q231_9PSEU|nr:organic hydroperoxide resistance protein [Allosaccharopolyspora coralli]QGK68638.1 Ohr family peroxiredoxin [Allosaccharopolyspora coralli]
MSIVYTAEAVSSGGGRDGQVRSSDKQIDVPVRMPTAMGGDGQGTNPEQLFAAAYATCFHGALRLVARNDDVTVPDGTTVDAEVGIGPDETSFGLNATMTGHFPGMDQQAADDLMHKAHQACPYSKATRGNIDVTLRATV